MVKSQFALFVNFYRFGMCGSGLSAADLFVCTGISNQQLIIHY